MRSNISVFKDESRLIPIMHAAFGIQLPYYIVDALCSEDPRIFAVSKSQPGDIREDDYQQLRDSTF